MGRRSLYVLSAKLRGWHASAARLTLVASSPSRCPKASPGAYLRGRASKRIDTMAR